MWGLFVLAPVMANSVQPFLGKYLGFLPWFQGEYTGFGILTAGTLLAIMILPFMSAMMRDALSMVPDTMKEASYGLGATTWEVSRDVTFRYSVQGIFGACFLGLGRALGEAIAVTFVIGNSSHISVSFFAQGNSITSRLANEFPEAADPLYLSALMELGLLLFALTFLFQAMAQLWLKRLKKKRYGGNGS
jgi:phosphate transport system permease protein